MQIIAFSCLVTCWASLAFSSKFTNSPKRNIPRLSSHASLQSVVSTTSTSSTVDVHPLAPKGNTNNRWEYRDGNGSGSEEEDDDENVNVKEDEKNDGYGDESTFYQLKTDLSLANVSDKAVKRNQEKQPADKNQSSVSDSDATSTNVNISGKLLKTPSTSLLEREFNVFTGSIFILAAITLLVFLVILMRTNSKQDE